MNGNAATYSYDMYHSAQLSASNLELNLFLLQFCAAFAPPDLYARRILDRFGLLNYVSLDLQHSNEFEPVLVHEMLALIIQIVKERRCCGFTASECVQRELICKLATGDATRSQLKKSLPRDLSEVNLQDVLDCVAQYSNPSGMKQGIYFVRFSYWKELDLYHPRWSPKDLQIAEEKYLQFCGVSAITSQLPCSLLSLLASLLGINKNENLSPLEVGNCKLSLIVESLLKKFAELDYDCKSKLQEFAPDVFNRLFRSVQDNEANISFSASDADARQKVAKDKLPS